MALNNNQTNTPDEGEFDRPDPVSRADVSLMRFMTRVIIGIQNPRNKRAPKASVDDSDLV
jgi:hypothetical protein